MFEKRSEPLLPEALFYRRMFNALLVAVAVISVSLFGGTLGYMYYLNLSWQDAFLEASLILAGMGPLHTPTTTAGKIYDALYALYSGIAFLSTVAILLAPALHRFVHRFHLDD